MCRPRQPRDIEIEASFSVECITSLKVLRGESNTKLALRIDWLIYCLKSSGHLLCIFMTITLRTEGSRVSRVWRMSCSLNVKDSNFHLSIMS